MVAMEPKAQIYIKAHTLYTNMFFVYSVYSVYIIKFTNRIQGHTPRQVCLFQIIPSDKINATVYEVIALMGHTPLR